MPPPFSCPAPATGHPENNKKAGGMNRPAFRIRPASRPVENQIVAIQVASRPFWAVCTVNFTRC